MPDVAAGVVVSTDPAAGTEVDRGSSRRLRGVPGHRAVLVTCPDRGRPRQRPVHVPDVPGLDEASGFNALLDADLLPGKRTEAFDPDVAAGSIVSTDPAAGTEVEPRLHGRLRRLAGHRARRPPPSRHPPRSSSPTCRGRRGGRRQRAARCRPRPRGEDRGLRRRHRGGRRHRHRPRRGHRGPAAAPPVDYVVSLGVEPDAHPRADTRPGASSPTCAAVAEADAVNALLDADLRPGTRTEAFDAEIAAGLVIGTDPAAGTEVQPRLHRRLRRLPGRRADAHPRADTGPGRRPRPAGVAEADAVNALLDADLVARRADRGLRPRHRGGRRHRHRPRRGHRGRSRGSTVDYVVSLGVEPTPTPEPTPGPGRRPRPARLSPRRTAVNALLDAGPPARHRGPRPSTAEIAAGLVIGTDPAAGTEVDRGTTVDYVVSLGVEPDAHPRADTRPGASSPTCAAVARGGRRQRAPRRRPAARHADRGLRRRGRRRPRHRHRPRRGHRGRSRGSTVDYVVSWASSRRPPPSRHPAPVAIPDLPGFAEADAVNALLDADLEPGARTEAFDPDIAAGAVIGTDPAAGTEVAAAAPPSTTSSPGRRADAHPRADTRPRCVIPDLRGSTRR